MQCHRFTRRNRPCPIPADRFDRGKPVCHVHDPSGLFQQQRSADRPPKLSPPPMTKAQQAMEELLKRLAERRDYDVLETPYTRIGNHIIVGKERPLSPDFVPSGE